MVKMGKIYRNNYGDTKIKSQHRALTNFEKRYNQAVEQYKKKGYFTTTDDGRLQLSSDNPFQFAKNVYGGANVRHYYHPDDYSKHIDEPFGGGRKLS